MDKIVHYHSKMMPRGEEEALNLESGVMMEEIECP
jgi:hypothetical protein